MRSEKTTARTSSPTGLYWSERGAIACAKHTPYRGSDTWNWERWGPVPVAVLGHPLGRELQCEICDVKVRDG